MKSLLPLMFSMTPANRRARALWRQFILSPAFQTPRPSALGTLAELLAA